MLRSLVGSEMCIRDRNRILTENLREVLALHNRGIHLIFTDIEKIRTIMEQELENSRKY